MSKQLYEEAIADLKKVKEIAEDNAKRAVVEAVAPRIRELIEKELLAEGIDDLDEVEEEEVVQRGEGEKLLTEPGSKGSEEPKKKKPPTNPGEKPKNETKIVDLSSLAKKNESVDVSVKNLVAAKVPATVNEMEQKLRYVEKMVETLANVDAKITESAEFDSNLSHLGDMVDVIYEFIDKKIDDPTTRLGYGLKVRKCLEKLEKLQETTMKRKLNEDKVTIELDLPGVDLGEVLDDASVDLVLDEEGEEEEAGEEEAGEEEAGAKAPTEAPPAEEPEGEGLLEVLNLDDDAVVEIDESMLRREIAFMKLLREADESEHAPSTDGTAPGSDEFDDFGGAEEEGEPLDMDITEAYGAHVEMDHPMDEEYMDEDEAAKIEAYLDELEMTDETDVAAPKGAPAEAATAPTNEDEMLEIEMDEADDLEELGGNYNNQSMGQARQPTTESLRAQMAKELKLQESLRVKASQLKKLYAASKNVSTIAEARAAAPRAAQLKAAYAETAERYNRSVVRFNNLSQSLKEGVNVRSNSGVKPGASAGNSLSKKLAETNLLNAKLLFTNKLLQTESLSARQKAQVIEQLDAAETIREAKLVYESLSKALVKPRRTVTEGRVFGSSSQATRPASTQTLSEGVEAERWAKLAGISK